MLGQIQYKESKSEGKLKWKKNKQKKKTECIQSNFGNSAYHSAGRYV